MVKDLYKPAKYLEFILPYICFLSRHMKKSKTEKPTCHICGKQFKNASRKFLLKKHLLFQHNIDEGAVFCEICPKTVFFSKRNYNKHMEKEHTGGKLKDDHQLKQNTI